MTKWMVYCERSKIVSGHASTYAFAPFWRVMMASLQSKGEGREGGDHVQSVEWGQGGALCLWVVISCHCWLNRPAWVVVWFVPDPPFIHCSDPDWFQLFSVLVILDITLPISFRYPLVSRYLGYVLSVVDSLPSFRTICSISLFIHSFFSSFLFQVSCRHVRLHAKHCLSSNRNGSPVCHPQPFYMYKDVWGRRSCFDNLLFSALPFGGTALLVPYRPGSRNTAVGRGVRYIISGVGAVCWNYHQLRSRSILWSCPALMKKISIAYSLCCLQKLASLRKCLSVCHPAYWRYPNVVGIRFMWQTVRTGHTSSTPSVVVVCAKRLSGALVALNITDCDHCITLSNTMVSHAGGCSKSPRAFYLFSWDQSWHITKASGYYVLPEIRQRFGSLI